MTVAAYHLGDEVQHIATPLLITESEREPLWPGQSRQLYDRLQGAKELVTFTAREGAEDMASHSPKPSARRGSSTGSTTIFDEEAPGRALHRQRLTSDAGCPCDLGDSPQQTGNRAWANSRPTRAAMVSGGSPGVR